MNPRYTQAAIDSEIEKSKGQSLLEREITNGHTESQGSATRQE